MKTEKIDVLLGLQWGDEGKGKVVDLLTPRYDVVARFQGGPNLTARNLCSNQFLQVFSRETNRIS